MKPFNVLVTLSLLTFIASNAGANDVLADHLKVYKISRSNFESLITNDGEFNDIQDLKEGFGKDELSIEDNTIVLNPSLQDKVRTIYFKNGRYVDLGKKDVIGANEMGGGGGR